jgi:hypothetical protein
VDYRLLARRVLIAASALTREKKAAQEGECLVSVHFRLPTKNRPQLEGISIRRGVYQALQIPS